jgi:single stranded DNA-binding protein
MNETTITVVGRLVADPVIRQTYAGSNVTTFRIATNARKNRPGTGEFEDGPTSYYNISAYKSLGANAAISLHRGEPVVVTGALEVSTFDRQDGSKGPHARVHLHPVQGAQGARRQGHPRRRHPVLPPGAKIGVVGPNGAGKSTLLKIMAGLDQASNGEARSPRGHTVGILMQEPALDESKTVLGERRGRRWRDQGQARPLQRDLGEMADPDADFDALLSEMGKLQEEIDHPTPGTSTPSSSRPWTRCAAPRGTPTSLCSPAVRSAAWRCASCCCRSPTCCCSTSRPTTSTPSRCSGSSSTSRSTRGRRRRHPRPVLPRQRRRVDPRARPRPRLPLRGQLLDLPGEEGRAPPDPGQEGRQAGQATQGRARVGALQRQGPPDQEQGPPRRATRRWRRGRAHPQARLRGDPDPAGSAPGQRRHRG